MVRVNDAIGKYVAYIAIDVVDAHQSMTTMTTPPDEYPLTIITDI